MLGSMMAFKKMMLPLLLIPLTVLTDADALPLIKEDARPKCTKIDECSCRLKNVPEPGLINLHGLVNDKHEPRFIIEGKSELTGRVYTFYYNPCMNFNFLDLDSVGCRNTSVCQRNVNDFYDLGNIDTTEFEYQNNSVVAIYKSQSQNIDGINRTSEIEFVCDGTEILGRLEFIENLSQHTTDLSSTLSVRVLGDVRHPK